MIHLVTIITGDYTSDTVLIENNGITPKWGCNPFSSDSIVFNENIIVQRPN